MSAVAVVTSDFGRRVEIRFGDGPALTINAEIARDMVRCITSNLNLTGSGLRTEADYNFVIEKKDSEILALRKDCDYWRGAYREERKRYAKASERAAQNESEAAALRNDCARWMAAYNLAEEAMTRLKGLVDSFIAGTLSKE